MTRINAFRMLLVLAALAAAATPAPAFAGDKEDQAFSKSHSFVVKVEDGTITVTLDGEDLPASRFRSDDGRLVILDEDGNEVKSFDVMLGGGGENMQLQWVGEEPFINLRDLHLEHAPKVMIGVHLDDPPEVLLYHLRLEPGEASMISGLFKDLPAHKAGLERFDVITAVDGMRPADPTSILDALADREPGDEVTFSVIQKGRPKEFTVTLEPFDRARMNPEALIGGGSFSGRILIPGEGQIKILPGLPPGDWPNLFIDPESGDSFRWNQEFRGQLREQIPQDLDERMESLNARIEELQKMLDRLVEQAKDVAEQAERD